MCLCVVVFYPVLPFTQIPWPLTPITWKQLSTLTSQVSGSVSPYLAARLVRLLRFTSSYCCPAYPFLWSCHLHAKVRYHLRQAQWSSLLPILCCLPCPSVWTDPLSPAVSSQCPVNKLQLSAHLHLGPISCRSLTPSS